MTAPLAWFSARLDRIVEGPEQAFEPILRLAGLGVLLVIAIHLLSVALRRRRIERPRPPARVRIPRSALVASALLLGATAFPAVLRGEAIGGYSMLLHVAVASVFVVALLSAAVLSAPSHALPGAMPRAAGAATRVSFLAALLGGLVAAATMLASMGPLLDQQGIRDMLVLHRYAGLTTTAASVLCAYFAWMERRGHA